MKRPFARFNGPGHNQVGRARPTHEQLDAFATAREKRIAKARLRRNLERAFALRFVRASDGPVYCVELAAAFGWKPIYARHLLNVLEREGLLTSDTKPAPRSGNGRRYFSLREAFTSQDRSLDSDKQGSAS